MSKTLNLRARRRFPKGLLFAPHLAGSLKDLCVYERTRAAPRAHAGARANQIDRLDRRDDLGGTPCTCMALASSIRQSPSVARFRGMPHCTADPRFLPSPMADEAIHNSIYLKIV